MALVRIPIRLTAALLCIGVAACGEGNGGSPQRGALARGRSTPACPDASFIGATIGFTVRAMPGASGSEPGTMLCAYQATDSRLGAFVSISAAPLAPGEDAMSEVRASARTILGEGADAAPIDVGERGFAYGSTAKSEAAAIRNSQVYRVDVTAGGTPRLGDRKDAVVAILRKVVGP